MKRPAEKTLRKIVLWLLCLAAASVVGVILYATVFGAGKADKISSKQDTNTAKADSRDETLDKVSKVLKRIEDCSTEGGVCYERGQRQLRAAIGSINNYGAAMVACADTPGQQTEKQIRDCANLSTGVQSPRP